MAAGHKVLGLCLLSLSLRTGNSRGNSKVAAVRHKQRLMQITAWFCNQMAPMRHLHNQRRVANHKFNPDNNKRRQRKPLPKQRLLSQRQPPHLRRNKLVARIISIFHIQRDAVHELGRLASEQ